MTGLFIAISLFFSSSSLNILGIDASGCPVPNNMVSCIKNLEKTHELVKIAEFNIKEFFNEDCRCASAAYDQNFNYFTQIKESKTITCYGLQDSDFEKQSSSKSRCKESCTKFGCLYIKRRVYYPVLKIKNTLTYRRQMSSEAPTDCDFKKLRCLKGVTGTEILNVPQHDKNAYDNFLCRCGDAATNNNYKYYGLRELNNKIECIGVMAFDTGSIEPGCGCCKKCDDYGLRCAVLGQGEYIQFYKAETGGIFVIPTTTTSTVKTEILTTTEETELVFPTPPFFLSPQGKKIMKTMPLCPIERCLTLREIHIEQWK